jgi:hypothetical protein
VHFSQKLQSALCVCALLHSAAGTAKDSASEDAADQQASIDSLLDAAEAAERIEQLIYPARGSAMSLYHQIISLDPSNADAQIGLARLCEHFLEAAQQALDERQFIKADSMLSKARMVYPQYSGIASVSRQIELLKTADQTRVTLDWRLVAQRSPTLSNRLMSLGSKARNGHCRVTINVSNDSEGRWIFKQMNQAPGTGRIHANIEIASPASIEMLCFNEL